MAKGKKRLQPYDVEIKYSAYKSRTDPPTYFAYAMLDGSDPPAVVEQDGVLCDQTDHIPIDVSAIPDDNKEELMEAIHELVNEFYLRPENRVKYQKWLADRNAKGTKI